MIQERSFDELVEDLRTRQNLGEKPPVLLLGAGASVDAGVPTLDGVVKFFKCADRADFSRYIATVTADERYRRLALFLQGQPEAKVTPGYQALATLCADEWFDVVLTTNLDPLLDDALSAARLRRRDYLLLVNGMIRLDDRLGRLLRGQSPRVKIVKLHGDLFQRVMAWTGTEMETYLTEIWPYLQPAVADRDFLIVGYSMKDPRVRALVESTTGSVWFTNREAIPPHLKRATGMRGVVDPRCAFEKLFPTLMKELAVPEPPAITIARPGSGGPIDITMREFGGPADTIDLALPELSATGPGDDTAQTMDDATSATFAVIGPNGPVSTAFLLAEPSVIVCDRYSVTVNGIGETMRLVDSRGAEFSADVIAVNVNHPFGPVLLAVPEDLRIPGLRLSAFPLSVSDEVQVLVAVGANTGISSGTVVAATDFVQRIEAIEGAVSDLVELQCFTAPGAAGGPVLDSALTVRGFIVAGSMDRRNPRSYAYPAGSWAFILDSVGPD